MLGAPLLSSVPVALMSGAAVALVLPGRSRARLAVVVGARPPALVSAGGVRDASTAASRPPAVLAASLSGAAGVALLVGGVLGLLLGGVTAVATFLLLRGLEPRAVRERR